MESPYITKKISRKTIPKLQRFKAAKMLEGRKITDMQAIDEALDAALMKAGTKKKEASFFDGFGMIRTKRPTDSGGDLDAEIYTGA
ncbi:MAG: hypothetical protein V1787_02795 [Candidatus Micrarchaeota archaeon]